MESVKWERKVSEIVDVDLGDGNVIPAEVTVKGGDVGALDVLKLTRGKDLIASVGRWAKDNVHTNLPGAPQRFGVEFGVKLTAKSGALISVLAEVAGEATMTVKMEWDLGRESAGDEAATEIS
jgi:molybdopterin-binding protein